MARTPSSPPTATRTPSCRWGLHLPDRSWAVMAALLLLPACTGIDPVAPGPDQVESARSVAVDQSFRVAMGQVVRLGSDGPYLWFRGVLEESRCPRRLSCVWEGNARIELLVGRRPAGWQRIRLDTHPRGTTSAAVGDLRLTLIELAPYPRAGEEPDFEVYEAVLVAEAVGGPEE